MPYAEKLAPVDSRLDDNLHGLAEAYRLQKKYTEAEPLYRRYLALNWGGAKVPEVLDRFSALLALSYFRDSQFLEARRKFEDAVDAAPLGEGLYAAMSTILFKAQLIAESEALVYFGDVVADGASRRNVLKTSSALISNVPHANQRPLRVKSGTRSE